MEFRYGDPVHDPTTVKPKEPAFHPVCLACGYDLRGNTTGRCPECGNAFVYREWERQVRDVKLKISEAEESLKWVPWSAKLVIVGMLLRPLGILFGSGGFVSYFARFGGFAIGLLALFLGVNVLRARRLPPWAMEHLKVQPDHVSGFIGVAGGILLMLSVLLP